MEGLPSSIVVMEESDDKYDKRRSQRFRCMLRYCFIFSLLGLVGLLRAQQRSIFQYLYDHHLQSYAKGPYIRGEYLKWLEEYKNSPLIPRMLPDLAVAFEVLDGYEETQLFFKEAKPPFMAIYYANWCPHSANAIPVIQEFAKHVLQPNHIRLVAIEESNPFSDTIPGFPTVYLHKKRLDGGIGTFRKEFRMKMNVNNLIKFLKQHVDIKSGNNETSTSI